MRVVRHGGGVAAHDAGERLDLGIVCNDADFFIDGDSVAVEQLERFASLAPADIETAMNLVEVKNVRWAAELEHHVIRNVDQGGDAALAATGQAVNHPAGRDGFGVDLAHHAA